MGNINRYPRSVSSGSGEYSPLDIANLLRWGDASDASSVQVTGSLVDSYDDKSSGSNDATQVSTARPTYVSAAQNGLNAIRLNGSTQELTLGDKDIWSPTDGAGNDTALSSFISLKRTGTGSRIMTKWFFSGNTEWIFYFSGTFTLIFQLWQTSSIYIGRTTTSTIALNDSTTIGFTYDGSEASSGVKIYIDGIESSTSDQQSGSYTGISNKTSEMLIGADQGNLGTKFTGDWYEEVVTNSVMSTEEIAAFETYSQRWR